MAEPNLATLPIELLHHILSYSIGCRETEERATIGTVSKPHISCPLYNIAATCRHLRDVVESFTKHLLLSHRSVTKFKALANYSRKYIPVSTDAAIKSKTLRTYRCAWVKWVMRNCAFCGKASTRRALMDDTFHCCQSCDRKEWPDKITMTVALQTFNLTKLDLFTPNPLFPTTWIPPIRYAVYDCVGVETTVFMKEDVEVRAKLIHGEDGLEDQKKRKKRRMKIERATKMRILRGRWVFLACNKDVERGWWRNYTTEEEWEERCHAEFRNSQVSKLITAERERDGLR
ncbi:uncharacterized protein BDZ99DRAFT_577492 [Mytilinidion resinicola]|uniref:F-box domain-containing protein n=1 Tax=Mytilinidion resinicola TaxID=574789 RepID=A0A6A6XYH3_9PEZI|nr:uncharacterized protein BDZ99DRAFT_577492 [Mytilinidion resinicola]KAF2801552.1 hypothetical protein BDZ99DRAFT_577492 [Mytilinidion resinicola]